jgi:hypothetical protein
MIYRNRLTILALIWFIAAPALAAPSLDEYCVKFQQWALVIKRDFDAGAYPQDIYARYMVGYQRRSWMHMTINTLTSSVEKLGRAKSSATPDAEFVQSAARACPQVWSTFADIERSGGSW